MKEKMFRTDNILMSFENYEKAKALFKNGCNIDATNIDYMELIACF